MPPGEIHWWLNLASLAGIAILAVPAWSLNFRKKRLREIRDALREEPVSFRDHVRGILSDKWNKDVSDWRRVDEVCLFAGYALVFISALLRLFFPVA